MSKSERFKPIENPLQQTLDFGSCLEQEPEQELETETIIYQRNKSNENTNLIHLRQSLPAHLPRKVTVLEPAEDLTGRCKDWRGDNRNLSILLHYLC